MLAFGMPAAFTREQIAAIAALANLERDYADSGKGELFGVLRAFLPGANAAPSYEEAASRAGMSVAAFNSEVHRLRSQFRQQVYAEVTGTVSAPHEIDEEIFVAPILIMCGRDCN